MTNNKQGFTLVELSIVLVIIGLLIGGILAAQSMINTTKIQSQVRQIGQFDAVVANFKDKFGGLPGDSEAIAATPGDNDGLVDSGIDATAATAATAVGETVNFWNQLTTVGLKTENAAGATYTADSYVAGTGLPRAKVGTSTNGVWAFGEASPTVLANMAAPANMYIIMDCSAMTTTTLSCSSGLSGNDALALDTKMDNGVGTTGNVTGFDASAVATWAGLTDGTEAAPTLGSTNDAYVMFIRMGLSTGDMQ